jgi:two-component system NtrC family response regulator
VSVARKKSILLVDDDESLRRIAEFNLREEGYEVISASDGLTAFNLFKDQEFDLVIADIRMPGLDGIDLLNRIKTLSYETPVIIITAHGTIETAIEAMKLGAMDFITKPFSKNQLSMVVKKTIEYQQLIDENKNLRRAVQDRYAFENIVGKSEALEAVYETVAKVAESDSSVIIYGESGTGKELFAKAIHFNSPRKNKSFVTVNCSAVPESLFESELFGHKKGSFTGAATDQEGKFRAADEGTIFLDEIAEIPVHLQPKILRVLQEGEVDKIGAVLPDKVNVRIISATNKDLEQMVRENRFREDLFYRLNIVPITLPPLRMRKDDIPLLADHFLQLHSKKTGKANLHFDKEIFHYFERYDWPGNVRELENVIERMVVMSTGNLLTVEDLPEQIRYAKASPLTLIKSLPHEGISLEELEKELIKKALEMHRSNQSKAAQFLGISRQTLLYRMKKYNL